MKKGYFNTNNYNPDKHWHIGYYNDGYDIEAIGIQRLDNGTWDVFFNDFKDDSECETLFGDSAVHKEYYFGIFLFNAKEEEVEAKFKQWVQDLLLPFRKNKE
jgi:hypothetical protein